MKKITNGAGNVIGKRRLILILSLVAALIISTVIWVIWGNTALQVSTHYLTYGELPRAFDGFRIAQVSDLHDAEIGEDNERLIEALRSAEPNIIVMTGDMIDSRRLDIERTLSFVKRAMEIAPCYYVTGNHESRISEYPQLKKGLLELGVTVLENDRSELTVGDDTVVLLGINDPLFSGSSSGREAVTREYLEGIVSEDDGFTILLAHRPEVFKVYVEYGIDLALSGHVHGGQFRIPFVGGVYVPNQGLFPEYDAGLYTDGGTNMIISRGIGNSAFPFRLNNRPELVLIELSTGE